VSDYPCVGRSCLSSRKCNCSWPLIFRASSKRKKKRGVLMQIVHVTVSVSVSVSICMSRNRV